MRDVNKNANARSRRNTASDKAAGDQDREVQVLMRRTGISYSQILALIHRYGRDRDSIERAAARLRPT